MMAEFIVNWILFYIMTTFIYSDTMTWGWFLLHLTLFCIILCFCLETPGARTMHFVYYLKKGTNKIDCDRFKKISLKKIIFGQNISRLETSKIFNRINHLIAILIFNAEEHTWDSFQPILDVWRKSILFNVSETLIPWRASFSRTQRFETNLTF